MNFSHLHTLRWHPSFGPNNIQCTDEACDRRWRFATESEAMAVKGNSALLSADGPMVYTSNRIVVPVDFSL